MAYSISGSYTYTRTHTHTQTVGILGRMFFNMQMGKFVSECDTRFSKKIHHFVAWEERKGADGSVSLQVTTENTLRKFLNFL